MGEDVTVHKDRVLVQGISRNGYTVVQKQSVSSRGMYAFSKRALDVFCALIAIVLCAIPMLIIAICIRVTSLGKAMFLQKRVGKNGKLFTIYKFRTMVVGAENLRRHLSPKQYVQYIKERKLTDDPRITSFGHVLRRTSLDELPQLINILRGDMSFIGPRPLLQDEIEMYGSTYSLYTKIRPGLTGLWQIKSRCVTTLSERAKLDEEYCLNRSIGLDLRIFFKTFAVVFSQKGAC